MIRIIHRSASGDVHIDWPADQMAAAAADARGAIWIDLDAPTQEEYKQVLVDTFHFHPLAIEDAIMDSHFPKQDDYGSYLYLVFHTVRLGDQPMDIATEEIDVFLGPNYLVTMHDTPRRSIERLWNPEHHLVNGLARGPAMLLYELLDSQVDTYIPIIDGFEAQLETLGDEIFRRKINDQALLDRLLTAKSSALRLHRILAPQRELLGRLSVVDYQVIPAAARIYYRDVYDHLARLADLADSTRDLASSTIETYLAQINNRMNEVMKVLTMLSAIFIPMSFVASVYGMNFHHMPELEWEYSYLVVWLIFAAIFIGMILFFRQRKWI